MKLFVVLISFCLFFGNFSINAKENKHLVRKIENTKFGIQKLEFGFTPLLLDKSKLSSDISAIGMAHTVFIPLPGLSTPFEFFVGAELFNTKQIQTGLRLGFDHYISRIIDFSNDKKNSGLIDYFNSNAIYLEPYITKPFLFNRNHHFFVGASIKFTYNLLDKGGYSETIIGDTSQPVGYRNFIYQYPLSNTFTSSLCLRLGYCITSKNHSFSFALLRKQDFNRIGQIQVSYSDFTKKQNAFLNLTSSGWGIEVIYGINL